MESMNWAARQRNETCPQEHKGTNTFNQNKPVLGEFTLDLYINTQLQEVNV